MIKHGLQTATSGTLRVRMHTLVQQQQPAPAKPQPSKAKTDAARRAEVRRPPADLAALKGVVNISTLARAETAADRVKKRLEERRRAEAA